jgi:hypothetical protein
MFISDARNKGKIVSIFFGNGLVKKVIKVGLVNTQSMHV